MNSRVRKHKTGKSKNNPVDDLYLGFKSCEVEVPKRRNSTFSKPKKERSQLNRTGRIEDIARDTQ